ncbi:MAG: DUF6465 family protein [Oscillospiraceae bacterium]|jgi:hypothetical protein
MAFKKDKAAEVKTSEIVSSTETAKVTIVAEPKKKAEKTKKPAEKKAVAVSEPNVYIEFDGKQVLVKDVLAQITAAFKEAHKRTAINSLDVYIKPDEGAAYYVVNEKADGEKIDL